MFKDASVITTALNHRNDFLSTFWLADPTTRSLVVPELLDRSVLMIDAEDAFTEMLALQLKAIGLLVTLREYDHPNLLEGKWDLIIMGPGPGNPANMDDPRIRIMRATLTKVLSSGHPFIAECLSHQILCLELGFKLIRKIPPNQGIQKEINLFGTDELVGFYNTYAAKYDPELAFQLLKQKKFEILYDLQSNEVHATRGPNFISIQFHVESLLTRNSLEIISSSIKEVLLL